VAHTRIAQLNYGQGYHALFSCLEFLELSHEFNAYHFSAWISWSGLTNHASVQALVCGQQIMCYGHILISSLVKRLTKKVRLGNLLFSTNPRVINYCIN